ncbi:HAMP domain-containing sensor histidine kinase [Coraliomargarita sp. SDUM461004]|uniref:histidine kinase n=1 Tax=Thalassobacterium sedimentorum TaxID=3041258 RepID=A0ABU1AJE1_9BACT|nr:HAMP domain-containing sensor histidine kinase [Coraliomargarita sp. SDUM461004]MDQ8194934.1 HAMP domain-containing sensor histidine kinase [Coraliomargarita sp. SDUM461004]
MKRPFQSIRWRIQVWHGLILFIAIAAFCMTAYQLAWLNQSRRIDREIQRHERQLFKSLIEANESYFSERNNGNKRIPFPEELYQIFETGKIQLPEEALNEFSGNASGYYYFAFANADGELLLKSENAPDQLSFLPLPDEVGMQEEFRTHGNLRESAHSFNFGFRIIIGHDIQSELEEKHRFGWSLGASGSGLWLIGLLGGWWLAGKAIRPIQFISQTATRIAEGNLNERINTAGTDSELDQLSHVLNHSFDRLNAILEQQRQFTADASHELRTPLTILLSESQRMRKRGIMRNAEDYQESFELCHDAATRMRHLVESLLLLARQDDGYAPLATVDCDLATIIQKSIKLHQALAETKAVKLQAELPNCPLTANPDLLAIVFNNLVGNAVQHHQGNGLVQIKLTHSPNAIIVNISDDGPGISTEALPRIFDRFYRADLSRSDAHAGHSGLGLALAQTIIRNMGGKIEVSSKLSQGSTFTATLPTSSKT